MKDQYKITIKDVLGEIRTLLVDGKDKDSVMIEFFSKDYYFASYNNMTSVYNTKQIVFAEIIEV